MVTQITDYEDRAQARLPEQFKGKELITALVRAFANETQDLEDAVYPMLDLLDISTMIGAQLDGIGDILTTPRDGKSDADYRVALKEAAAAITASGTPEQVIERYIALTGLPGVVSFLEDFPAGYCIGALPVEHSDTVDAMNVNRIKYSREYENGAWTKRGTAAVSDGTDETTDPNGGTSASKVTGIADFGNDLFQSIGAGEFSNSVALGVGVWLKRISTAGTLRIWKTLGLAGGDWRIDLSALPDAWVFLTKDSAEVSVQESFASAPAGEGGVLFLRQAGASPLEFYLYDSHQEESATAPAEAQHTEAIDDSRNNITLVTGGIGTDEEFKGGYIANVTRSQARAIIEHGAGWVRAEGSAATWVATDVLFLYSETDSGDILSAMEAASGVGIYVGLIDLFALEDGDLFLLEDDDTMYVTYDSSGR